MRRIPIIGDIDSDAYALFSEKLSELEDESSDEIEIELASEGGNAHFAIAFTGRMRVSPCKFTVKSYGIVGSAAVIILAAGDTRIMTKESWLFVHEEQQDRDSAPIGSVAQIEHQAAELRRMETQWSQLLEFYTKTPAETWDKLHRKEIHISADECVKLGIVDEVI